MPRISKIAPGQRRGWLDHFEEGKSIEKIAKDASRDVRTVREHIERARLERDFEAAQRDQLRDALRSHQQDMLTLLARLGQAIHAPELTFVQTVGLDFGLEDLLDQAELARYREVGFGRSLAVPEVAHESGSPPAVTVTRNTGGPQEVVLAEEDSRLWRALKEHVRKDPVWRHIADWKKALLGELEARAALNRAIRKKAEEIFGARMLWGTGHPKPYLGTSMVWWIRARLTKQALGEHISDVAEDVLETDGGQLETLTGQWLSAGLQDTKQVKERLRETMIAMTDSALVDAAAETYRNLQNETRKALGAIEEHSLIHHIPGRCRLCKKLEGR